MRSYTSISVDGICGREYICLTGYRSSFKGDGSTKEARQRTYGDLRKFILKRDRYAGGANGAEHEWKDGVLSSPVLQPTSHVAFDLSILQAMFQGVGRPADFKKVLRAVDVYLTPIMMKKSRPAHCLVALSDASHRDAVADAILNHSSTIGLRILPFEKVVLPRSEQIVATSLGDVRVKQVTQPDGRTRWKTEHDDVVQRAQEQGMDYQTAKARIDFEVAAAFNTQ